MRTGPAAIIVAFVAGPALAAPADPAAAARAWLGLIDRGAYASSWTEAGTLFRTHVSQARWAGMAAGARGPFGAVISRRLAGDLRSTSLPGAPDGHYARLTFTTAFAHKRRATETVVMAQEPSGWRVDGYFIR
jgi:serine/threonine-protein kinase